MVGGYRDASSRSLLSKHCQSGLWLTLKVCIKARIWHKFGMLKDSLKPDMEWRLRSAGWKKITEIKGPTVWIQIIFETENVGKKGNAKRKCSYSNSYSKEHTQHKEPSCQWWTRG